MMHLKSIKRKVPHQWKTIGTSKTTLKNLRTYSEVHRGITEFHRGIMNTVNVPVAIGTL